jgi:cbb3-type cytochrome oxidase subunit 1
LHTNAVIFAFGGCGLFASAYYVVQRTCHVRLFGDKLAAFTFWGWQLVILAAAISLPLGYTQGKEYAELEWPIDILITLVWVVICGRFSWAPLAPARFKPHLCSQLVLWFLHSGGSFLAPGEQRCDSRRVG